MFCGNCGAEIQEGARFCGACGQPLIAEVELDTGSSTVDEVVRQSFPQPEPVPEPGASRSAEAPVFGAGPVAGTPEPSDPKKHVRFALLGVIAAVVVAILLVAVNFKTVSNTLRRTFSSPEKYYQHVEKEAMGDTIRSALDIYENNLVSGLGSRQQASTVQTVVTVGEPTRELVESLAGMDMDWLGAIGILEDVELDNGKMGVHLTLSLNDTQIGQVSVVMDEDNLYLQLPELSEDFVRMPVNEPLPGENGMSYYQRTTGTQMLDLVKALPERARLEKLLDRYVDVIVENIDDVEKDTGTLKADSVEQSCTTLTVRLRGETLQKIVEELCDTAMEDKELQELCKSLAESSGMDSEDAWDDFQHELQETRSNADYIADQADIKMKLYVDGKGQVQGRTVEINDYIELEYAAPEKGSEYGVRLTVSRNGYEQFAFEGGGKGNDGVFTLGAEGIRILEIEASGMDRDALKKGYLNGTFDVTLSSAVANQLEDQVSYMVGGRMLDLRDAHLVLETKSGKNGGDIALRLMLDDEEYLSLTASGQTGKAKGVTIPGDSVSVDRWSERLDPDDLRVYIDNLEEAGVPGTLLNLLLYGLY